MEKEKIELAAQETAYRHFGCKSCNTNNPAFSCEDYCGIDTFIDGFSNGARWRIDAAWHDGTASCEARRKALVLFKNGNAAVYKDLRDLSFERLWGEVDKFAYMDDLLPDVRKEAVQ